MFITINCLHSLNGTTPRVVFSVETLVTAVTGPSDKCLRTEPIAFMIDNRRTNSRPVAPCVGGKQVWRDC